MENVLSIVDMHKTYPGGVHAVRGVSFDVMEGESVAIIGHLEAVNPPYLGVLTD